MKETERRRIIGIAAGCALTLGAGLGISAYQSENQFQPVSDNRDIQINQVVFSQDENGAGYERDKSGDAGEIWQKDHEAKEKNRPGIQEGADYLYEDGKLKETDPAGGVLSQDDQNNIAELIGKWNGEGDTSDNGNAVYELTGDSAHADLLISGDSTGFSNGSSGSENAASSDNGSTGNGNRNWTEGGNNDGNNKPAPSGNPAPAPSGVPLPSTRPADTVKDPEADASNKSDIRDTYPDYPAYDYDENKFKGTEETNYDQVVIQRASFVSSFLYLGQNIDQRMIFNSLDTYVKGSDNQLYFWGADALDKYIRIDGVSIDGGENWITEFPMTIPRDMDKNSFMVKASYRFSETGKWIEKEIPYRLEDGCLYILKNALTDGNGVLQKENILNGDAKYPGTGQNIILYKYQMALYDVAPDSNLYELFPGWQENGEAAGWFYQTENGRHILEPMDMVELDDGYTVQLKLAWMNNDGQIGNGLDYGNLIYLQTLTGIMETAKTDYQEGVRLFGEKEEKLTVPDYVQAVQLEDDPWNFWLAAETDYLEIPESVIYVDFSKSTFKVKNGYLVDKSNPYYESEIGMLVNKEKTEILGIPYNMKKVTVPETCQKINIAKENQIREIILESDSMDKLRGISYGNLTNCKITIQDQLLQDFLAENYEDIFQNEGNQVVLQNSKAAYMVKQDAIVSTDGELYKVIDTAGKELTLAPEVTRIGEEAFSEQGIQKLILAKEGQTVELSENCFKDSKINSIICYTQVQYDSITKQLKEMYPEETYPDGSGISVQYLQTSNEGHAYLTESQDGTEEIILIRAAGNCTAFDGTITTKEGKKLTVTELGDNAFAGCDQLVLVSLPEAVHRIGYQAFKNCTSLEGVFSEATDRIVIGNKAFDGCGRLQFIAFNAMEAEMQGGYNPEISDGHMYTFYAPAGSSGYGDYASGFDGVTAYHLIKAGEKGRLLYGYDAEGKDWLLLKGIGKLGAHISLPENTLEVYHYAMDGTRADGDFYQIDNLGSIKKLYLDTGAFRNSALGGVVTLGETFISGDGYESVFENCSEITEISMESVNELPMCIFSGCKKLKKLTLKSTTPPSLTIYSKMDYKFFGWNEDDLEEQLSLSVPKDSRETYIRAWRYLIAGYADIQFYNQTAYNIWWNDVQDTLMFENGEMPADREVDERLKAEMLKAENRLRSMMGMEEAEEPMDYYPYHIDSDGMITLVGVPKDCTKLNLADTDKMGMFTGWSIDYIGEGAFTGSAIKEVDVPATLAGLQSGFLAGTDHTILLTFEDRGDADPPELMDFTKEAPFTFGEEEANITIKVPDGEEEKYIEMWSYPMAGYKDLFDMLEQVPQELMSKTGEEPSDQEIHQAMAERLLDPVNRLRRMMGLEPVKTEDILENMLGFSVNEMEQASDQEEEEPEQETDPADETEGDFKEDPEEQDPDKDPSGEEDEENGASSDQDPDGKPGNSGTEDSNTKDSDTEDKGLKDTEEETPE